MTRTRRQTRKPKDDREMELLKRYLREAAGFTPEPSAQDHPPPGELLAHARGELEDERAGRIRIHALYCRECFGRLAELGGMARGRGGPRKERPRPRRKRSGD